MIKFKYTGTITLESFVLDNYCYAKVKDLNSDIITFQKQIGCLCSSINETEYSNIKKEYDSLILTENKILDSFTFNDLVYAEILKTDKNIVYCFMDKRNRITTITQTEFFQKKHEQEKIDFIGNPTPQIGIDLMKTFYGKNPLDFIVGKKGVSFPTDVYSSDDKFK